MAYIRTHHLAKTFMAFLLGLPFVLGVFSNTRPNIPIPYQHHYEQQAPAAQQQETQGNLFGHIAFKHNSDV